MTRTERSRRGDKPRDYTPCLIDPPARVVRAPVARLRCGEGTRNQRHAHKASVLCFAILVCGVDFASATPSPDAAVRVVRQEARWAGIGETDPLADDQSAYYVISGEVRNDTDRTVVAVKLAYELLDETGEVVASEFGYNYRAEDLREPDYESGKIGREELRLETLSPRQTDMFRMVFLRSEIPRFHSWRVRLADVEYAPGGEKTRKY